VCRYLNLSKIRVFILVHRFRDDALFDRFGSCSFFFFLKFSFLHMVVIPRVLLMWFTVAWLFFVQVLLRLLLCKAFERVLT
jgi:hypothetical protein